jgi:GPH family glycoside/pentoside/hexuronide:cation symporter
MVITFVTTFMLVYLYDAVGFSSAGIAALTVIITGAKIWDSVADLIMGFIVDRTRSRWGKLRPYILFTALPVALLTVLMFSVPRAGETGRLAWFGAVYLLWGMVYTMCDVPFWGLAGTLSRDTMERTRVISLTRTFGTISLGLVTLLGPQLARLLSRGPKTTAAGWQAAASVVAVLGMGLFLLAFFNTREKVAFAKEKQSLRESLRTMAANRPLLQVLSGSILGFGRSIIQVGGAVVALIVFGDEAMFTYLGAALILALVVSTLATPLVLRFVSKKGLMIGSSLLASLVYLAMYLAGWESFALVLALIFASGLFTGFFIVVQTAMIADSVDYLEYKTGSRNEGVCFAGLTFVSKLMGAFATMAFGTVVAAIGYAKGQAITPAIQGGVWFAITIIPALSCALGTLPFFFYELSEKRLAEMMEALLSRRGGAKTPGIKA